MLFIVRREDIVHNLQSIVSIIEKKQTIPILSNVLIKADRDHIKMTGTDLEIQLTTKTFVEIRKEGITTVSARKFYDICRNFGEGSLLTIESKEGDLIIRSGKARFKLGTLDPETFPKFTTEPPSYHFEIESRKLLRLLQLTAFSMATQDVRYYLNGLMISIDHSEISAVGSNGHRLGMYKVSLDQALDSSEQMIVPRKGVLELLRMIDSSSDSFLKFRASHSCLEIQIEGNVFLSKLLDGKYPDFKGVLSQQVQKEFNIDKDALKNALTRVSILSSEKFRKINLIFKEHILKVCAENQDQDQAEEEIDIDYQGNTYEVSLNVSYLLDAVSGVQNERVSLSFTENSNICLIKNPDDADLNYVVMPLV